jgi:hypothetical protein
MTIPAATESDRAAARLEKALTQALASRGLQPTQVWVSGTSIFVTMPSENLAQEAVEIFKLVSWVKSARLMQDDMEDGGAFYAEVTF